MLGGPFVTRPARLTSLADHIGHVVGMCADEQMRL
jgi:hypothetical protein